MTRLVFSLSICLALVVVHATCHGGVLAFTAPSSAVVHSRTARNKKKTTSIALGASIARNGIIFDDLNLGQGRRVLPGDTVYCYYEGSFTKAASNNENNPAANLLSGFLGGGNNGNGKEDDFVFDSVSKFVVWLDFV